MEITALWGQIRGDRSTLFGMNQRLYSFRGGDRNILGRQRSLAKGLGTEMPLMRRYSRSFRHLLNAFLLWVGGR